MKWVSLLKDIKEKVGFSAPTAAASSSSPYPDHNSNNATSSSYDDPLSRERYELELDFKRSWEEFRTSTSEMEKEKALNVTIDVFCRLVQQHSYIAQLNTLLVETHIFSFVVGRAFVSDIERLKVSSKTRSLEIESVISFFSEDTQDGILYGSNLLHALGFLVSGPIDKQSLLDSGIMCCLVYILDTLLGSDGGDVSHHVVTEEEEAEITENIAPDRRFEVEGCILHIMKALASHSSAAQGLIEDDSLKQLFEVVANGSLVLFSRYKEGLVPLHTIQLHRHAMQVLGLLLSNDNGSTAAYIRKHQLIKVLLMGVKGFTPESGDPAYTMGIVDLLLECVELSYRHEAGGVRLREDIHNAHGYQFLIQFALVLSGDQNPDSEGSNSKSTNDMDTHDTLSESLSPTLSRLLDVVVNLAQTGATESTGSPGSKGTKSHINPDDNYKVKDLDAVQMLQDIFLKANSRELQAEVLNRMFKIFSSHLENYMLCQQLRTVPLLILNMGGFPSSFQEIILKILEYAVTVVNCIPEQELLSLCCLLQQPVASELKRTILSFFVKLVSFDQQYKKFLREVGVLDVLLDDLRQHKFLVGPEQNDNDNDNTHELERKSTPNGFMKHLDGKDAILSSPKMLDSGSGKFPLFEAEVIIPAAWDCLVSLLRKAEHNQVIFRSGDGVIVALPFLASDVHRAGVLRVLSCLIIEDSAQAHPDELGALVEASKSGMVISTSGSQYKLTDDAKCDIFGAVWRVLGANSSAQRVFGEATGFSLILTTLHSFHGDKGDRLIVCMKVFTYMLRVITAGTSNNAVNRTKLHAIISSHTFSDLLSESGLICVEYEKQVMQLFFELALEILLQPSFKPETNEQSESCFKLFTPSASVLDKQRVYNAGAVKVLIRLLLIFTPKLQLEFLILLEELARAGSFNQESLTSTGCVELLLEMIYPFLSGSSSLLPHALRIIEVLGAYRLSSAELRVIIRYILQVKQMKSGQTLVDMMERFTVSDNIPLAPFLEMDMSKSGHASIQVPLGERSWPPTAGYSFVCWFQYQNFLKSEGSTSQHLMRIFSVGGTDGSNNTFHAEIYLQDDGTLTLATSNSSSLSFSGLDIDEYRWHHLAVVHSKPNALAGLFQASVSHVYLNGKLRHTGRLGYSPSSSKKALQVTIGTPVSCARVSDLSWKIRSCYLFEEVLTPGSIFFMYILGRGYRGLFQDTNLLQFVPNQACGGGSMSILDALETDLALASNSQKPESANKQETSKTNHSGIVWDLEILRNLSLQLSGKKLIFSLDGTCTEAFKVSGTLSVVNLVDPLSAAASPIGGIPRFGRLHGDIYVCKHSTIGETMRPIGGIALVLALVQVSETRDMLHMALTLFACALHQNPQNVRDMQSYRGYHLLALLLHPKMSLFDMHSLDIFFQIAACEASFHGPKKLEKSNFSPLTPIKEASFEDLSKFHDDASSSGSHGDMDDFSVNKDAYSHISELDNVDLPTETSNCVVLSNPDMVEHVLLDWTLWVAASVPIQISLLGFLENLVSMHWYRNHNLTVLRKINLIQHLLVTLHRGDVEVPVLEKLVNLVGVILKDGFLVSELEHVVRFVIMTFDPPELTSRNEISRESMGKHVIVRNMLLEMLIDLVVTISSEELLEQWHKIVSSKLITYFFDEAVHPTTMRWVMTLLGVCLTSSPTFSLKFRTGGGYQGLVRVLPSFYDSPDIYYILFCLIFGKPVYPRLPEVRLLDFHALMPSDGSNIDLKFLELLDSVIAMAKSTFDKLSFRTMIAYESGAVGLVAELVDACTEMTGELQGEALMHKTYAARLMGGDASAPAAATSVLRFMVDLAKICPPFSAVCRRAEFLDKCVDLYFSCVRSAHAVKMAKKLTVKSEDKSPNGCDESPSSHNSLPLEQEHYSKTSISLGSFPPGTSSEDVPVPTTNSDRYQANSITSPPPESHIPVEQVDQVPVSESDTIGSGFHDQNTTPESHKPVEELNQVTTAESDTKDFSFPDQKNTPESRNPIEEVNQASAPESGTKDSSFHDQKTTLESDKPVEVVSQVSTADSNTKDFSFHDNKTIPESQNPVGEVDQASAAESGTKDSTSHDQKTTPESQKPAEEVNQVSTTESNRKDFSFPDHKTTPESLNPEASAAECGTKGSSFHDRETTPESQKPAEEVNQVSTTESDRKDFTFPDHKTTPESHNPEASTAESGTKDLTFHGRKTTRQGSSLSSVSLSIFDSPLLSDKTTGVHKAPSSSQLFSMGSWQSPNFMESKPKLAPSPSMASSVSLTFSLNEYDNTSSDTKKTSHLSNPTDTYFPINPLLLLDADDSGYGGGPCSAGATAILDFMAEVLSDFITDQLKATSAIESILENVSLHIDAESVLVFQGLCLSRLMNFLERRILRDDEEDDKKLDKTRWSTNLDALCLAIVDRVYIGAFPEPSGVLKTLEFLLSMLQLANKDGRIEQAGPPGKGILSIGRHKQLDAYILSMFKNMNRAIMYCFHPQFLISVGEDELLSRLGLQIEQKKRLVFHGSEEDGVIDISTVLQVLVAHKRLIFCPCNPDNDLICCLCINLTSLLHDQRQNVQNSAVEILKYLLVYRKTSLEDLFVSKPNQGPVLDAFHGGFDRLVTGTTSSFFDWFHASEVLVSKTLEQSAVAMWVQYIAGSVKFPGVRIKNMDARRKKEITKKSKESRKLDQRHWEQINERRIALESVCDQMCTELRVVRQDKYGWVLHAESEWQTHLQQLVHERGIFPILKSVSIEEPKWQLCAIEGPYRMRKKIERCKLKPDMIETILNGEFEGCGEFSREKDEIALGGSDCGSDYLPQELFEEEVYDEEVKDVGPTRTGWNETRDDSVYEASVLSAAEFSVKSSIAPPSLRRDTSVISENVKTTEEKEKLEKELSDNGEYLIRPYLEHNEKIKSKYNCERVVSLDKHDGIFLIGEHSLYIIENFYIDDSGCICEKESEDDLSVIDKALGVKKDASLITNSVAEPLMSWDMTGGRAWAHNSGAWGRENAINSSNVPHLWRMWKRNSVHEIARRDYQLRPVAVEIFSMDGCNDLLVFHKKEREEVLKNLATVVPQKNAMLDPTISGAVKQDSTLKFMEKTFTKRWQDGEISNFQYLMHVNTQAGRGYSDLTQYPVFPWILSDYENENLDLTNPETFRKLDKPMGCQTMEGELEFKKRFESWDDPEIPKFHYGSHYSSAGIVLFYLIRLPPFSSENQKLQGGQFDHADRLFHNLHDTWSSAAGRSNTSDVKELIPEFFYLPEFLENRFDLDLGEKQSGEKIGDVGLPPWAKGSTREFIKKHREALESDYVSENLHHWIDLIFGYKQRGKPAEEAVNVFYHYTYEGSVDIDAVSDPAMKAAILAQINHFGQTPKQIFHRPHVKRKTDRKPPLNPLRFSPRLIPHEIRKTTSPIAQIVTHNDKILIAGPNNFLKPRTYTKSVSWGFPDLSLRFMTHDQERLLSTHENLHGGHQIQCASATLDGQLLVTGADDGMVCVWRIGNYGGPRTPRRLTLKQSLCAHTARIMRLYVSQPYMIIVSASDDCTVILWDLSALVFLRQLPEFPCPVSALYMNDLTGEIVTAAGGLLAVWSVNGECLAVVNASQLPSDFILSVATCTFSDWVETNWYITGHQSGGIKVWQMVHNSSSETARAAHKHPSTAHLHCGLGLGGKPPEYTLLLHKVLKGHKHPVTALHLSSDLKLLLSGDSDGHLFSWTLPDDSLRNSLKWG